VTWQLGLDVGTSTVKAVVTDPAGRVLASGSAATPWRQRGASTEVDADDLLAAVLAAARRALDAWPGAGRPPGPASGVGVTGFAESGVLLDGDGTACGPVIAWHDPRGDELAAQLQASSLAPGFPAQSGQPVTVKLTAVKYRWLHDHIGSRAARARFLTVPEWVVLKLGGSPVPELSLWSRTGFLDIRQPRFLPEIADWAGLPCRDLPAPAPAGTPSGRVSGLPQLPELRDAVLTVAGHDHVCAAYGAGVTDERDVCDSWGNGEALIRSRETLPDVPGALAAGFTVSYHVLSGRRALFRGLGTGLVLRRILALLGSGARDHGELDRLAAAASGLSLPRVRVGADGSVDVLGIPDSASSAGVWRAALLAAFDRVQAGLSDLEQISGPVRRVVGCGGWLRSEPLRTLKAAQVPGFTASSVGEPAAVGAALLAGRAARCAAGAGKSDLGPWGPAGAHQAG
jgi:sugar (pentulose or hexulose) kinase